MIIVRTTHDAFHLAIPAHDLDAAYRFYVEGLGCKLARWKCPVQVVVLPDLPRGSTGKVRRADVRELVATAS